MPISIDLDHITGRFRSIGAFQLTPIAYIFQRMGKWLDDRLKKADKLEEGSRGIPVVWIEDESVQCWLDEVQRGALSPNGSPPGFWEQLRSAADAFVAGFERIPQAIAGEEVLPRLLTTVAASLRVVLNSIMRFETPTAGAFDPGLRTAGDLFGIAAMAFRAVVSSKEQILRFLFAQVLPAYILVEGEPKKEAATSGQDPQSLTNMLDSVSRYIVGALLILPYLPDLLGRLWESASIAIRVRTIEALAKREAKVFELRRTVIDLFYVKFQDIVQTALSYTHAAAIVVALQSTFWLAFVRIYGLRLLLDFRSITGDLADFLYKVAVWITDGILLSIENILKFDLAPYIVLLLSGVVGWLLMKIKRPPPFTILDLLHAGTRELLHRWITDTVEVLYLGWPLTRPIQRRLRKLDEVVNRVFEPVPDHLPETAWPSLPPPFPSIFDQWAKASGAKDIRGKFDNLGKRLSGGLQGVVGAAARLASDAGDTFDGMAASAARGGSMEEWVAMSHRSAELARAAFGEDRAELDRKLAEDSHDAVAGSFENWLALGGFEVLGTFLEQYITGMIDWFRTKEATGNEAMVHITRTSPAKLARRAALGRVVMQRMTMDARGHKLDGDLVREIADRFRGAIGRAYRTGDTELTRVAAGWAV